MPTLLQLLAALNDEQKKRVDTWEQPHHSFSDPLFGGPDKHRVTFELPQTKVDAPKIIHDHLSSVGAKVKDYGEGTAEDKHGRTVKIAKMLSLAKAPQTISEAFASDPSRAASKKKKMVTISRDPHDVAAMSTGQGWTSCMNMEGGGNEHYLPHDIKHGTHIAYIHDEDDPEAKHPSGRFNLKPYTSKEGHTVLHAEPRPYGSVPLGSREIIDTHVKSKIPLKEDHKYSKNEALYDDGSPDILLGRKKANDILDKDEEYSPIQSAIGSADKEKQLHYIKHSPNAANFLHFFAKDGHPEVKHHILDMIKNGEVKDPYDVRVIKNAIAEHGNHEHRDRLISMDSDKPEEHSIKSPVIRTIQHGNDFHRLHYLNKFIKDPTDRGLEAQALANFGGAAIKKHLVEKLGEMAKDDYDVPHRHSNALYSLASTAGGKLGDRMHELFPEDTNVNHHLSLNPNLSPNTRVKALESLYDRGGYPPIYELSRHPHLPKEVRDWAHNHKYPQIARMFAANLPSNENHLSASQREHLEQLAGHYDGEVVRNTLHNRPFLESHLLKHGNEAQLMNLVKHTSNLETMHKLKRHPNTDIREEAKHSYHARGFDKKDKELDDILNELGDLDGLK